MTAQINCAEACSYYRIPCGATWTAGLHDQPRSAKISLPACKGLRNVIIAMKGIQKRVAVVERLFAGLGCVAFWLVTSTSYLAVLLAFCHWVTDSWSGLASLGVLFAVFVGVPGSVGYATGIWQPRMDGLHRFEVIAGFALPVFLLGLAGLVIAFGRLT